MKRKSKIIIVIIGIVVLSLCLSLITMAVVKCMEYKNVKQLCRSIKEGEEIHTTIADATTAPVFLDRFYTVTQLDKVLIPLVEACFWGNEQAVRTLIENGADPNFTIKGYWTAVEALEKSKLPYEKELELLQLLYDAGADINKYSSEDSVVVAYCSKEVLDAPDKSREGIILWLLDHGAVRCDNEGQSLLHDVARGGNEYLLKTMINDYRFDVNQVDCNGRTPLIAAMRGLNKYISSEERLQMVSALIEAGADKRAKDNSGKTAYDYAVENGYTEAEALLRP